MVAKLPKSHATPEIRLECSETAKRGLIVELKQKLSQAGKAFNAMDGVRIEEAYGWWLVRASNTQSALIVRAEGNTEADLDRILREMQEFGVEANSIRTS